MINQILQIPQGNTFFMEEFPITPVFTYLNHFLNNIEIQNHLYIIHRNTLN